MQDLSLISGSQVAFLQSHITESEKRSSEAVDLLRSLVENATFLSGTTYGIEERHIEKANKFLKNITD